MFSIRRVKRLGLEYFVIHYGNTTLHTCMGLAGAKNWVRAQEQKLTKERAQGGAL